MFFFLLVEQFHGKVKIKELFMFQPWTLNILVVVKLLAKKGRWLWNFIRCIEIVKNIERPLKLSCENSAVIILDKNNKRCDASRLLANQILKASRQSQRRHG